MNTGLGAAGDPDPYWKIISFQRGTFIFTEELNAIIMTPKGGWSSSPSWPSKWIGVTADGGFNVAAGIYEYQLSFASASYLSKTVEVYFMVDDAVTSVTVSDGSSIIQTITTFSGGESWNCFSRFILTAFGPKTTILTFTVNNNAFSPNGLLVQFGEFNYIPSCPTPAPCKSSLPVNKMPVL
eukprot:gene3105-4241_t